MGTARKDINTIPCGGHTVTLGRDALHGLERLLADPAHAFSAIFILGDEHTLLQCLPELLAHVPRLEQARTIVVHSGESAKDIAVCRVIWDHLAEREADRHALLVNLGGGVISDLGGFIAGTWKRGIRCVHVPTTLMGMVDAALGGKCGIDVGGVKNMVGLFNDPLGVFVHVRFLRTLGKRELLSGLAEMIKHGLVRDAAHYRAIHDAALHDIDALAPLIQRSAEIKSAIVSEDPHEGGTRKLLNFGHTIGHGVEALSMERAQRGLLHGEAVVVGMLCEAWLSWRLGHLQREDLDALEVHLLGLYRPYTIDQSDHHRIIEFMRNDKKNRDGRFNFTLLTGIGSAKVDVPVTAAQVKEAIDHYRERTHTLAADHHP